MHTPDEHQYGIRAVHVPDGKAEIDIVAVHGLNGGATKTWLSRESKVSWLCHRDFLPRYVNNARVLIWGYNASFSSLVGDQPSNNRIHHHAHTLVANLCADRQLSGMTGKPIIFLCHSLGGIVVKRALAYSQTRTAERVAHEHDIFTSTYGVLFFGTPHKGSSKASFLACLQRLASVITPYPMKASRSDLVTALQAESETLQNISDFFVPIMKNFAISFFWEQRKTDLKFLGKDYIVPSDSAAPIYDDTERAGIDADHSGLVKFESPTSPGFQMVMNTIMRYCAEAAGMMRQRHGHSHYALEDRSKKRQSAMQASQAPISAPWSHKRIEEYAEERPTDWQRDDGFQVKLIQSPDDKSFFSTESTIATDEEE